MAQTEQSSGCDHGGDNGGSGSSRMEQVAVPEEGAVLQTAWRQDATAASQAKGAMSLTHLKVKNMIKNSKIFTLFKFKS